FSSRRRHTRFSRDWSSDVCSSDLRTVANPKELKRARRKAEDARWEAWAVERLPRRVGQTVRWSNGVIWTRAGDDDWRPNTFPDRSEERRVGKECRWRGWRTGEQEK